MLSSITPLGERGRRSRWPVTAAAYTVGSAAAAAAFGALLGAAGGLLAALGAAVLPGRGVPATPAVLLALAALAAVGLALDLRVGGLRLPTPARQVDEDWLARFRGWVYGAGFGAQLGVGVVTIVTTSTVYLTWAAALLSGSAGVGGVVGAAFGLVRALPVLAARGVTTPRALQAASARWERARAGAHTAALAALAALVPVAAAAALLTPEGTS